MSERRNAIMVCVAVALLTVLGLVMLASTSVWIEEVGTRYTHLRKQAMFAVLGAVVAVFLAFVDHNILRKHAKWLYLGSVFLLCLCYVPGIGKMVNGETRWIIVPVLGTFQPSETAKIALIVGIAAYYAHYKAEVKKLIKGCIGPCIVTGVPILLIFFEKDMGTAAGLGAACLAMIFVSGTRLRHVGPPMLLALAGFVYFVITNPNRLSRINAFTDLEAHKLDFGLQQWRSLLAFGSGGMDGLGLGNGAEKHGYLPFAHTDFIFPMVGEELGLWFTLGTVLCFVLLTIYGFAIAVSATSLFSRLMAVGLTCAIVIPAILNMGVTTALLPNTGLPLPLVSYGGTNLVFTMAAIGILINIHRTSIADASSHAEDVLLKKRHCVKL